MSRRDHPVRPLRFVVTAAAAAVLAAGCGSTSSTSGSGSLSSTSPAPADNGVASLSATEILAKAKVALPKAESVHISGAGSSSGQQFGLDMRIKGSQGGAGTITLDKSKIEVIRIGQTAYLKADEAFWRTQSGNAEAGKLLGGKYLKGSITDPKLKDLASFTDLSKLATVFLEPDGKITKGERKTIRGIDAIGLVDDSADGGILYVALRGEPLPLQLAPGKSSKSTDTGSLDFLDYGKAVELPATPPEAQVVDVSKLGGS
jgi:hypothetical protein